MMQTMTDRDVEWIGCGEVFVGFGSRPGQTVMINCKPFASARKLARRLGKYFNDNHVPRTFDGVKRALRDVKARFRNHG